MNGDDRWPDVLARRLHTVYGNKIAVVNAGIGGNQVVGPAEYSPRKPYPGGPSAKDRLDRDVLSLSGIAAVGSKASTISARTAMPRSKQSRPA
jgi:hypothetical protein